MGLSVPLLCLLMAVGAQSLRVMTFNIWVSGTNVRDGIEKIAKHIKLVDPDIVALQEVESPDVIVNITKALGKPWSGIYHCNSSYPDTGIITKHTIINGTYTHVLYAMGVKIQLNNGQQISFWSAHLDYRSYGPYAAFNKRVVNSSQIMSGEFPTHTVGRVQNAVEIIINPAVHTAITKSDIVPFILAGDFNVPSDLDWKENTRDIHGGWVFEWPVTRLFRTLLGLTDSFRELHPDPTKDPGISWSTVNLAGEDWDYTIPETLDRIDFINYRGPLKPTKSYPYCGSLPLKPMPHHQENDYPSDHFAFVTEFEHLEPLNEKPKVILPPQQLIDMTRRLSNYNDFRLPSKICGDNYVWNNHDEE